nr:glycosyltransferase family 39 protein [Chloroflexota bacterium]
MSTRSSIYRAEESRQRLLLLGILAVSTTLLFFNLGAKSMWIDEYNNVDIASAPDLGAVTQAVLRGFQRQPPLYFWLLHLWIRIAGTGDATVRVPSALMGLASVLLLFLLARQFNRSEAGLIAAYLLAISPTFVLYARMARYYLPTLLFSLLSCCLFWRLIYPRNKRGSLGLWAVYTLVNILLLLSSYVAGAALVCQLVLMLQAGTHRLQFKRWLASIGMSGAIAMIWFVYALPYIRNYPLTAADYASGPSAYVIKLAYPFYSFAIGETLFPWRWPAIIGGLAVLSLMLYGIAQLRRQPTLLCFLVTGLAASIILVALSTIWFVVDVPFINIPSRAIFAAPFLYLLIAIGIEDLRSSRLKALSLAVLTLTAASGLVNYYHGNEFHNPIYAVPMREIVARVQREYQPGDVIVSEPDAGFGYYYRFGPQPAPVWYSDTALALLQDKQPERVWLITFGRDATRSVTNEELLEQLVQHYDLDWEEGYVEQDPIYRQLKERLLHRPAYRYKVVVQRYVRGKP